MGCTNLIEILDDCSKEDECRDLLENLKWPYGVVRVCEMWQYEGSQE